MILEFTANDALSSFSDWEHATQLAQDALEATLRHLLLKHPSMAVLLVETFYGVPNNTIIPRAYKVASAHYGVPHVRYPDVIRDGRLAWSTDCAKAANPAMQLGPGDGCLVHPPWHTHELISHVVLASLTELADELLQQDEPHEPHRTNNLEDRGVAAARRQPYLLHPVERRRWAGWFERRKREGEIPLSGRPH